MKIGIALVIVFLLGGFLGSQFLSLPSAMNMSEDASSNEVAEEKPLYWVAPMDKNYRRDGPGLSPMGMELVPVYAKKGNADGGAEGSAEGDVTISAAVENNLGVKTAEVGYSDLYQPIDTVGTVQLDESKIKHIHSRVEGWIEVLNVSSVGDTVKKGQTLYELYSPALVNAQEEYLAALRSGNNNLIKASKSRLFSLGLSEQHAKHLEQRRKVDQRVKVIAEIDGVVINLMVRQGMFIKPATEVISIGSLDSVWILGEVFERQSYLVSLGQEVEINFNAMPAKQWQGKISYIYPQLDAATRTLQVRINIDNPKHILKPNMLANLRIISQSSERSLSIPKQALIKSRNHNRVVKSLGDGKYQSVLVELGYEGLDEASGMAKIQILDGLEEGDRVVTSAQFLIDSESNIDAELDRLSSNEPTSIVKNNDSVMAMGVINSVMAGHDMLNITHEPVEEWGWPDMTMNFDVDGTLDLSQLSEGERIHFTIKKYQDGSIMITDFMSMSEHSHMKQEAAE
jgi:Cu(I)/Ag(I) efflux system membrane fusion protein